jgi:hypothetical protein
MLVLLNKMLTEVGKENLFDIWPNLEVYFHGGVNFDPYREQYKSIPLIKTLNTTRFTMPPKVFLIQDLNNSNDLLLMLDYDFL